MLAIVKGKVYKVYKVYSIGGTVWRENTRGKTGGMDMYGGMMMGILGEGC